MKTLIKYLTLIFCFFGFSQSQTFNINWTGTSVISTTSKSIEVPYFDIENHNFSFEKGLFFSKQWTINGLINETSGKITNLETIEISKSELKQLPLNTIPNGPQLTVSNARSRDETNGALEIYPIFYNKGVLTKIIQFTIEYRLSTQPRKSSINTSISSSSLKSGNWYRFRVDTTGVHKLTSNFLRSLGVNTSSVNPKNIKIYGHGGKSLPLLNSDIQSYDMIENTIQVIGEDDYTFNDDDYILMYAIGPKKYNLDNNSHINPYSDDAYYYLNISSDNGLRMNLATQPNEAADVTYESFHDYKFVESDEYNIAKLGRRWFGHRFYVENTREFNFEFPNIIISSPVNLKVFVAATSESNTSMSLKLNGTEVNNFSFSSIDSQLLASEGSYNELLNINSSTVSVELNYNNNGNPSASAYLDYISVEAERSLISLGTQFEFKHKNSALITGVGAFTISNASSTTQVWDITNPYDIQFYENQNAESQFTFKTNLGTLRTYQALGSDFYLPKIANNTNVDNQDIKGTVFLDNQGQFKDIDYLIIAPNFLMMQAERLANINTNQHNLNVKVFSLESIYQEFSSGMQDIAGIRNFIKYVYDNASEPSKKLRYLCLFGDASFDYKNRVPNNTNIVPSWYSINSISLTSSFLSDDFFGMMDSNEGAMSNSDKLDIAVGRILANSPQQAKEMVDKVESYYTKETYGSWRNNFLMISDDVDEFSDRLIQETTDIIAEDVKLEKPFLNVFKIHSDSYVQETTSGGARYTSVNKAIFDALEVGAIVVNYFGHGGEDGLAVERIFDKINAQELNNPNKLNCFVTITCEYTKFDNPYRKSAGEYLFFEQVRWSYQLNHYNKTNFN
jgi:hypothetical protein